MPGRKVGLSEQEFREAVERAAKKFAKSIGIPYSERPDPHAPIIIGNKFREYLNMELGGNYAYCERVEVVQEGKEKNYRALLVVTCNIPRKYKKRVVVAVPLERFGYTYTPSEYTEEEEYKEKYGEIEDKNGIYWLRTSYEEPEIKIEKYVEEEEW
jgi:hypothetical protein